MPPEFWDCRLCHQAHLLSLLPTVFYKTDNTAVVLTSTAFVSMEVKILVELLALRRQQQEDFEANLLYIVSLGLTWTIG